MPKPTARTEARGRLQKVRSAIPDAALKLLLKSPAFSAIVSQLPEDVRQDFEGMRAHLLDDFRRFKESPVRTGVLREAQERMVGVFLGELQHGGSVLGANLFKGSVTGGSLVGCNAALVELEAGEIRGANLLVGTIRGGRVHAVNVVAADVFDGEVDGCRVLVGNVYGGRVRTALLVGDVLGGDVEAARQIGSRSPPASVP
jgi:hypothetical protein